MKTHDGWALCAPNGRLVVESLCSTREDAWVDGWDAEGGVTDKHGDIGVIGQRMSWTAAKAKARKMGWRAVKVLIVPVDYKDTKSGRAGK